MSVAILDIGHTLVAVGSEPIESDSDIHVAIPDEAIGMSEEHNLVMIPEPVVRDDYIRRSIQTLLDDAIPMVIILLGFNKDIRILNEIYKKINGIFYFYSF